jgi:DNA-binding transcriptional regulator YiaG
MQGLKLLQSVRGMKAPNFDRTTEVASDEVALARQDPVLAQAEFAADLSISKLTPQQWKQGADTSMEIDTRARYS